MRKDTESRIFKAALQHYGPEMQKLVCIEEMSELTKELCKNSRGQKNEDKIAEEIAYVQIMLDQMTMFFGIKEAIEHYRLEKVLRLSGRIAKDAYVSAMDHEAIREKLSNLAISEDYP